MPSIQYWIRFIVVEMSEEMIIQIGCPSIDRFIRTYWWTLFVSTLDYNFIRAERKIPFNVRPILCLLQINKMWNWKTYWIVSTLRSKKTRHSKLHITTLSNVQRHCSNWIEWREIIQDPGDAMSECDIIKRSIPQREGQLIIYFYASMHDPSSEASPFNDDTLQNVSSPLSFIAFRYSNKFSHNYNLSIVWINGDDRRTIPTH